MNNIHLYTKISSLPADLKNEVSDFIDFLKQKSLNIKPKIKKRKAGLAKNIITIHENFDDPIEGFEDYTK
jgi:hypothetical protein